MPEATFVQDGINIDHTPDADVAAGQVVVIGVLCGVASRAILADTLGSLAVEGVFDFAKYADEAVDEGAVVYWDEATNTASATAAYGEAVLGVSIAAALAGDDTVRVKLTPGAVAAE